jgi:hypothetical protein
MARAQDARTDAEATELQNVRERCLRAEAAFLTMAERARRTLDARATNASATPTSAVEAQASHE